MQISEGIAEPTIESLMRALLAFIAAGAPIDTPVTAQRARGSSVVALSAEFTLLLPAVKREDVAAKAEAALSDMRNTGD